MQSLDLLDKDFYKIVLKILKELNKDMDKGKKMFEQNDNINEDKL